MKRLIVCGILMIAMAACHTPDANDQVREARRNMVILDSNAIVDTDGASTWSLEIQNQTGGRLLSDLTVDLVLMDDNEKVLWTKRKALDVADVKEHSTKEFIFKEGIPDEAKLFTMFSVSLAPDDESSDFLNYREFKRVQSK